MAMELEDSHQEEQPTGQKKKKKPSKAKRDAAKRLAGIPVNAKAEKPGADHGDSEKKAQDLEQTNKRGADHKDKKRKTQADSADTDCENRVWVGGLPPETTELKLSKHFGSCGAIRTVRLIKNSRLIFRGSAFISFKKNAGMLAALDLDSTEFEKKVMAVKKAAVPIAAPDLQVYIAGLTRKATEEVLRKDFGECGEFTKFRMLKETPHGKFKGVLFVTYKDQGGVDAALKFHETEYGGRIITVRLASDKPTTPTGPKTKKPPSDTGKGPAEEEAQDNTDGSSKKRKVNKGKKEREKERKALISQDS